MPEKPTTAQIWAAYDLIKSDDRIPEPIKRRMIKQARQRAYALSANCEAMKKALKTSADKEYVLTNRPDYPHVTIPAGVKPDPSDRVPVLTKDGMWMMTNIKWMRETTKGSQ